MRRRSLDTPDSSTVGHISHPCTAPGKYISIIAHDLFNSCLHIYQTREFENNDCEACRIDMQNSGHMRTASVPNCDHIISWSLHVSQRQDVVMVMLLLILFDFCCLLIVVDWFLLLLLSVCRCRRRCQRHRRCRCRPSRSPRCCCCRCCCYCCCCRCRCCRCRCHCCCCGCCCCCCHLCHHNPALVVATHHLSFTATAFAAQYCDVAIFYKKIIH